MILDVDAFLWVKKWGKTIVSQFLKCRDKGLSILVGEELYIDVLKFWSEGQYARSDNLKTAQ